MPNTFGIVEVNMMNELNLKIYWNRIFENATNRGRDLKYGVVEENRKAEKDKINFFSHISTNKLIPSSNNK